MARSDRWRCSVKNVTRVTERCVLWLVPIFSLLPLLLATPDATAKASRQRDTIWRHPALDSLAPQTIAILPAVVCAENAHAMRLVEQRWRQLYSETGHCWLSANASRVRMAAQSPRGDSLYEVIARQVPSDRSEGCARIPRPSGAPGADPWANRPGQCCELGGREPRTRRPRGAHRR